MFNLINYTINFLHQPPASDFYLITWVQCYIGTEIPSSNMMLANLIK